MTDPTPQTPTRDDAVRKTTERLRYTASINARRFDDDHPLVGELREAADLIEALASAPAPASGGVDAVAEACAQAAEGPEYWPHPKQPGDVLTYRGTKDGNWLAVKPPFKLDPYSQGRADAAAAVRALSPTPVSEAGGEAITARYTNWRGETVERTFIPHRVFFGSNEWHPEPQVLIEATDCEKGALRTFAAAGFGLAKPASAGGDVATELATQIMALDWKARKDWTVDEQADRHGEIQVMIDAALKEQGK